MKISPYIRDFWREVEDILTAATGPLLIVASATAAADVFSNGALSLDMSWLPLAWALARACAVTIWLGVSYEHYLEARSQGISGGWWFLLTATLFLVDLQTGLLFGVQAEKIGDLAQLAVLHLSPVGWLIETGVLTVVLIAVHRAIEFKHRAGSAFVAQAAAITQPAPIRQSTQPGDEGSVLLRRGAPVTHRAFWDGPYAPLTTDEEGVGMYELVSDGETGKEGLTRQTPQGTQRRASGRPRRRDAGSESSAKEQRVQRLMAQLRVDPHMTIEQVAEFLDVSRGTAVTDRREAKQRLEREKSR